MWRRRKPDDNDIEREIRAHLEAEADEQQEAGLSQQTAREAARRAFGNQTRITEDVRAVWLWTWAVQFRQDLMYALRAYSRTPGFAAVAVLTLALGIGATSAIFSVADSVLLHPLPYRDPDRLVVVWVHSIHDPAAPPAFDSFTDFQTWSKKSKSFEQLAAVTWATGGQILTGAGKARDVLAMPVDLNFFPLLGMEPQLGRTFRKDDLQRGCSVVLSHSFWSTVFANEPAVVGRNISLGRKSCTVLGVMPERFSFYPDASAMWLLITPDSEIARNPLHANVGVFGRLKRNVSAREAQQELANLYRREHGNDEFGRSLIPETHPLSEQFAYLTGPNLRLSVRLLLGAVCFVLLIACVNVANLLLGRSVTRQKELAVRAALGSGRARLLRQLLTESLLLSFAGASVGILLAFAAIQYFRDAHPVALPPGNPVSINLVVLAFTVVLSIVTAVAFGIAPAHYASRTDLVQALRSAGRDTSAGPANRALGKGLVTLEVALSLVLLVGAGLLVQSLSRLTAVPLGFKTRGILTVSFGLPPWNYSKEMERAKFHTEALAAVRSIPGVENVAFASALPLNGGRFGRASLVVEGKAQVSSGDALHDVAQISISPDYFRVMNVPLMEGRFFDAHDREGNQPVAIVNEALARKYFPHENPIGKQVKLGDSAADHPWLTIVGLVRDEKDRNFFREMAWEDVPTLFSSVAQEPPSSGFFVVGTRQTLALADSIQRRIASLDSSVPVGDIDSMDGRLSKLLSYARFRALLLTTFAALALVLAAVGLYGVLSRMAAQRTQEFGVRMALGAQQADILMMVVKEALALTVVGLVIGLSGALLLTRFIQTLLYGVGGTDPLTLAGVSLALLLVAAFATYVPARRAVSVDPSEALRLE